jgi:hypothetical protein
VPGQAEQQHIRAVLDHIDDSYRRHCTYLTGDRLRGVIRTYVESLNAIKVRPTGGVYFVHRRYQPTLDALRQLVKQLAAGSYLVRVPLPDQAEMREMVITTWRTKAKDDLNRLARDIAAAQHSGPGQGTVQALYKRFQALQSAPPSTPSCSTPASTTQAPRCSWSAPSWAASSPPPGKPTSPSSGDRGPAARRRAQGLGGRTESRQRPNRAPPGGTAPVCQGQCPRRHGSLTWHGDRVAPHLAFAGSRTVPDGAAGSSGKGSSL